VNNRIIFSAIVAFVVSVIVLIALRTAAEHVGLIDHPDARKRHGLPVPLLGGVAIVLGTIAGLMVSPMIWPPNQFRALIGAIGITAIAGVLDDLHEISARIKLMFQFSAGALLTAWAGISLQSLGAVITDTPILTESWSVPFTLLAGVGLMNAVNMADGIDGLVGSCSLLTLGTMGVLAAQSATGMIYMPLLLLVCAALFGFLIFNIPYPGRPLRTFLGDTGSLVLGLLITWFAVTLSQSPISVAPPIVFVWLCGLFLVDFICIMVQRTARGRSPLAPDRRHWHHLLQRAGLSSRLTFVTLTFVHGLFCGLGVWMWKAGVKESVMLNAAVVVLVFCLIGTLMSRRWIRWLRRRRNAAISRLDEQH
jgi:UDP-GlcNAc:undecaprenyl-phosphate/decaprenyl-phosphate GlcNAc-1-phosphate transferase